MPPLSIPLPWPPPALVKAFLTSVQAGFPSRPENRVRLMTTMDQVNQRYGRGILKLASPGATRVRKFWAMKQERIASG